MQTESQKKKTQQNETVRL